MKNKQCDIETSTKAEEMKFDCFNELLKKLQPLATDDRARVLASAAVFFGVTTEVFDSLMRSESMFNRR
jgi:hypothetical protein